MIKIKNEFKIFIPLILRKNNSRRNNAFAALFLLAILFSVMAPLPAWAIENPVVRVWEGDSGQNGVTIRAHHVSLPVLLKSIESQSGIGFKVRGSMKNKPISVDVKAETWSDAVQKVLVDYSRVELWGRDNS